MNRCLQTYVLTHFTTSPDVVVAGGLPPDAGYESYGLPIACVRYSNVYGPGQRPDNPYCSVVSKFLADAHAGRPLSVHGHGEQTRDYTFVGDARRGDAPRRGPSAFAEGEVFNIGTGIEISVNALALAIGRALDVPVELRHIDRRDIDNIRRRVVNIEKARRMLRWTPQATLEGGLQRTADGSLNRALGSRPGLEPRAAVGGPRQFDTP